MACCKDTSCDEELECCGENCCGEECCDDAYDDDDYYEEVATVGELAPDFAGIAYQTGKFVPVELEQYLGESWVVLFFYPADFTFVCPTELEDLQAHYPKFKKMGVEIVSVSTDTHFTHMGRAMQSPSIKKIQYPMLSDASQEISDAYGVLQENGLAQRGTFIIDPDGVVQSIEIAAEGLGRSVTELLRKLEALQHIRNNPGHVCPCSWEKTGALEPSEKLVGKL